MRTIAVLALIAVAFAAATASEFDAEIEADVQAAQQSEARALGLLAHAEFMRVAALAQAYAKLPREEREVARIVAEEYNGDVGRLRIGQLTRKQQSELIPLGMSYHRDLNVRLAQAARAVTGADDEGAFASFLESAADTEVDATTGTMTEASLDALLNAMDEQTLTAFIDLKQTVLESAIEAALSGSALDISAERWPDFIDNAVNSVKDTVSSAVNTVKDTAVNAYNTVKNADIHDISGKVGEFAGKVKDVADTVSKYSGPIAALTAPIPYVGAAARAVDTAANVVSKGAGIVETGANLIHDNTKPGETVGEALGRAKDAAVDMGNKALDYAKNPGKLVDDVKKAGQECIANPSACMDKAANAASTVARLTGNEDLADKIDKANDMGQKALDALGIEDKKDKDQDKKDENKPDGGDKPDAKGDKPDGGKPEGGDKPEGGKPEDKPAGGDKQDGKGKPEGGDDKGGDRQDRGGDRRDRGGRDRGDRRGDRGDRRGDRADRGDRDRGGR